MHAKEDSGDVIPHVETNNPVGHTKIRVSRSRIVKEADNKMKEDRSENNNTSVKMKKKAILLKCESCNISFKKKN